MLLLLLFVVVVVVAAAAAVDCAYRYILYTCMERVLC